MLRRTQLVAVTSALALLVPTAIAHADETTEPNPLAAHVQGASRQLLPAEAAARHFGTSGPVTVMLELTKEPVALVAASTEGELSETRKAEIREDLKGQQATVAAAVEANGGQVITSMQSAINAIRVEIDAEKLATIEALEDVKAVREIPVHERVNIAGDLLIEAPAVWDAAGGTGYTGEGVKVAVLDSGIDYTHATFGGAGTTEAFEAATKTRPADFGPRVKGGIDLVGDDYTGRNVPVPDDNPIDCIQNGHGTHVAGTIAGAGVTREGKTYEGAYGKETLNQDFKIGPGVAPKAELYAVKVFGCKGSTDMVTEAIDWAVKNDMDVINMSLGSGFGRANESDSVAAANAVAAGVVVAASAGNSGPAPYLTGSPAAASGVISVSAVDAVKTLPGATIQAEGANLSGINANGGPLPLDATIHVLKDADGKIALGCKEEDYQGIPAGSIVVTRRGSCARVARAVHGQKAGAAAVLMVNSQAVLPPFEGAITENPDNGEKYTVTIPFLGVGSGDGEALLKLDGKAARVGTSELPNATYRNYAGFTSSGPRSGDSALRPSLSAPGVSTLSSEVGGGTEGSRKSGTSMAAPVVAGVAALARQAHPNWSAEELSSALLTTADPAGVNDYRPSRGGALVNAPRAVAASVLAYGDSTQFGAQKQALRDATLSFGMAQFTDSHQETRTITLENKGDEAVTYTAKAVASGASLPAKVTLSASEVTVPAKGTATVDVTLSVKASDVPTSYGELKDSPWFHEVSGHIALASANGNLSVPYLLVPRSLSEVSATAEQTGDNSAEVKLTNTAGREADSTLFVWGQQDERDVPEAADTGSDLAQVGASTFEAGGKRYLAFATAFHGRFSNAANNTFGVRIDVDGDQKVDHVVFSADSGRIINNYSNGIPQVFVSHPQEKEETKKLEATNINTLAPTDSAVAVLIVPAEAVGVTGKFAYTAYAQGKDATTDIIDGWASYDPTDEPFASNQAVKVAPGSGATFPLAVNRAAFDDQQPLGYQVVVLDNVVGAESLTGPVPLGAQPTPTPSPTAPAPSTPA
ncbi:MAG: S8 family serine peptidase, partial [Propionibacteriaceae bacterium]|nr:S8 family serine peptidase [Propionibacteriaceae bacterium]